MNLYHFIKTEGGKYEWGTKYVRDSILAPTSIYTKSGQTRPIAKSYLDHLHVVKIIHADVSKQEFDIFTKWLKSINFSTFLDYA